MDKLTLVQELIDAGILSGRIRYEVLMFKNDDDVSRNTIEITIKAASLIGHVVREYHDGTIRSRIFFDRTTLYDKRGKCPVNLPCPENKEQLKFLIESLQWLKTKDGYNASCFLHMEKWITSYPYSTIEKYI